MGPGPPPSGVAARRAQLAAFLRARRAAISPAELGLPVQRRRTPGLRREEVALRAGIGLSWYTWLEQGRDITPSPQVLLGLSDALALSAAEQEHLFGLAGVTPPDLEPPAVDELTSEMVAALLPHVAYVLGPRFDVVAHNSAAELIMRDLVTAPPERRNLLLWLFDTDAGWDRTHPAWQANARANLLDFRSEYDRHADDPAFTGLIEELGQRSDLLRTWWAEHGVQPPEPVRKRLAHPTLGTLSLLQTQARPAHNTALRLRILVPADDHTRGVLAGLSPVRATGD